MGQMTLAFNKQMLRVFDLVELEEFDHLVAMLDRQFLKAQEQIAIYSRREAKMNRHKQTNIYICIRTLNHTR
jgi:phosphate uptake regulator